LDRYPDVKLHNKRVVLVTNATSGSQIYVDWLREVGAIIVKSTSCDVTSVSPLVDDHRFDLVLFDSRGCGPSLVPMINELRKLAPTCPVVVAGHGESDNVKEGVKKLGGTVLDIGCDRSEFLLRLALAIETRIPCLKSLTAEAAQRWSLSPQQARILYYNLWSLSNQEIADTLNVTIHTVQDYQVALRRKTGARSKDGYLRRILEIAGVSPPSFSSP